VSVGKPALQTGSRRGVKSRPYRAVSSTATFRFQMAIDHQLLGKAIASSIDQRSLWAA
jgi:hypothetical protein